MWEERGKRKQESHRKSRFPPPCCENCDWKLRNDLKHIRFFFRNVNCSGGEEDKIAGPLDWQLGEQLGRSVVT